MKHVAKTLTTLSTTDAFQRLFDPSDPLDDLVSTLKDHWSYDLYSRRPGPALLENNVLTPTDLDLACFLSALVDRKAVINLPTYQSRRASTTREGEHVVSSLNRHGHVHGLVSNKEVFSFSVRITDANVITSTPDGKNSVGAFRNFMLVDLDGHWYDGWKSIEFIPSKKENDFLEDKSLWTGNTVYFQNFIHPNRWISFYGQYYLLTKLVVERLRLEAAALSVFVSSMKADGLTLPTSGPGAQFEIPATIVGESVPKKVAAFEAEIDLPGNLALPNTYANTNPKTNDGLTATYLRLKKLRYEVIPHLSFALRATELAFCNHSKLLATTGLPPAPYSPTFPSWITGAAWDREHKIKRTVWNRLVLHQEVPFSKGLAIRYRVYEKTERVSPASFARDEARGG